MTRTLHAALAAAALLVPAGAAFAQVQPERPAAEQAQVYADAQLSAFVAASVEVEPLTEGLESATPAVRQANTARIAAILNARGLTSTQYNEIATRARSDQALAARINALRQAQEQAPGE